MSNILIVKDSKDKENDKDQKTQKLSNEINPGKNNRLETVTFYVSCNSFTSRNLINCEFRYFLLVFC